MNRIFILISLFSSTILLADEVETVDGSILQGEILTIEDNNLTILTEFAGKIKIPDFRISRISCENELSFRMEDNRTFQGKINFSDEGKFSLENRQEPFLLSEVKHLWTQQESDPLILIAQSKAEALLLKWKHALGFDLTGSSGNSENFGLGIRLDSSLGNKLRGYDLYLSYNKADKKNTPIVDETKFGIEYDSKFYDSLAWYAKSDLENDRLEEVDLRATTALGLKYLWLEQEEYQVDLRSGIAFRYEKSGSSSTDDLNDPAIDLGLEYTHQIREFLLLESDFTYVPSLNNFDDYLITKDTGLMFALNEDVSWMLRSGLSGTYNSTPVDFKEELDLTYYLRMIYNFK